MRLPRWAAVTALVLLAAQLPALRAAPAGKLDTKPGGKRVLFLGNSLTATHDLPGMLVRLVEQSGAPALEVESIAPANYGLQDHWESAETRRRVREGSWDLVVLQQGPSATEGRPSLLEYAVRFAAEARKGGARVALYMVWPAERRAGDFDGVSESYRLAAERCDGLLFPAGEAWRIAWEQDASLPLYAADRFHPGIMGTYLAALVMFEQISGRDALRLSSEIPLSGGGTTDLPAATALALQSAAAEANHRFARD